jgi:hypothetical protein
VSPTLRPTPEQEAALQAFRSGKDLKLIAVAGSGKTTTLRLMAEAAPHKRLMYLAFNSSVKTEGKRKMPRNVQVLTLHGLAYREMVRRDPHLRRKFGQGRGQIRAHHIHQALSGVSRMGSYVLRATLGNFLRSNLQNPTPAMIPVRYRQILARGGRQDEEGTLLEGVRQLWQRIQDPSDPFPLSHDAYVKLWAMSSPRIGGVDALLVDEAQDLDPVFLGVLERQIGIQRIYVGDPAQQIYGWRGAVNALDSLGGEPWSLTWSFRFGDELAALVRGLMAFLDRSVLLQGKAAWSTELGCGDLTPPFTTLCRTNAGVVDALVRRAPQKAHVLGGVKELVWLLEDAEALRRGEERTRPHPDLLLIESWEELEALAENLGDPTAAILSNLANSYPDLSTLAGYLQGIQVEENDAELVVSTAHKAKGREWERVELWEDFPPVWDPNYRERLLRSQPDTAMAALWEEENLLYVALTRAMRRLSPPPHLVEWPLFVELGQESQPANGLPASTRPTRAEPVSPSPTLAENLELASDLFSFLAKVLEHPHTPPELREQAQQLARQGLRALGLAAEPSVPG